MKINQSVQQYISIKSIKAKCTLVHQTPDSCNDTWLV